jgi:aerobic-type carbon monoxide dehydrogenase small subunit (CoxS/CutS family)
VPKKIEEREEESSQISRRQFLKEAGLVVGGAGIGSITLLSACTKGGETETVTKTVTVTNTLPPTTTVVQTAVEGALELTVNGKKYSLTGIAPSNTLAFVLREKCLLPGTKVGCNRGECGSCTVIVDGRNIYSCLMLAVEAAGKDIQTVEGLANGVNVNKLQQAFMNNRGFQCGFCAPGMLMSGTVLLKKKTQPTMAEVQEAMSGNLCPCGNMTRIVKSVMEGGV